MAELFETLVGARAALRRLPGRGLIRVTGGDRVRFLNAMLSADVAKLPTGGACPALQLDRKGHVLAELWVLADPDAALLDVAPGLEAELTAMLEKHIIADDVALASLSDSVAQLALEGPGARDAARAVAGTLPEPGRFARADFAGAPVVWLAEGSVSADGLRAIAPRAQADALAAALALPELDEGAAELLRIDAGLPLFGRDVSNRNFPQEARLDRALSFTKGCYVGQEIVARIQSRGAVNRVLVKLDTDAPVAAGAEVSADGHAIGQVTSSAPLPSGRGLALAYLKVEHARTGQRVSVGGVAGAVAAGSEPGAGSRR